MVQDCGPFLLSKFNTANRASFTQQTFRNRATCMHIEQRVPKISGMLALHSRIEDTMYTN